MSSRVLQMFECDRCHATDEGPDSYWPKGWSTLRLGLPQVTSTPLSLCWECSESLQTWWRQSDCGDDHGA